MCLVNTGGDMPQTCGGFENHPQVIMCPSRDLPNTTCENLNTPGCQAIQLFLVKVWFSKPFIHENIIKKKSKVQLPLAPGQKACQNKLFSFKLPPFPFPFFRSSFLILTFSDLHFPQHQQIVVENPVVVIQWTSKDEQVC